MSYVENILQTYHAFSNLFRVEAKTVGTDFSFYVNSVVIDEYQIQFDYLASHNLALLKSVSVPKKLTLGINEKGDFSFFKALKGLFDTQYFDYTKKVIRNGYKSKLLYLTIEFFSAYGAGPTYEVPKLRIASDFFITKVPVPRGDYANSSVITYTLELMAPHGYNVEVM